jgi:hypothetical protein
MSHDVTRRDFVKGSIAATAGAALVAGLQAQNAAAQAPPADAPKIPMAKIGDVELSRLMLGGNLISGYSHSRDLSYVSSLMRHYNTDAKIIETLQIAEAHGINSVNMATWDDMKAIREHVKNGGKMKLVMAANPIREEMTQVQQAIDMGGDIIYIQGACADKLVAQGKIDLIAKEIDYIKNAGIPAGIGAHTLRVIVECEKAGIPVDFYQKTLHTHDYPSAAKPEETADVGSWDNSWCKDPEKVIEVMAGIKKPWVAFKVMAAGAITPQKAFPHAFNNGADFVLAGMFDFQVEEDAKVACEAIANVKRTRPWFG